MTSAAVTLAGAQGRLIARAGLEARTRRDVDQAVVTETMHLARVLGRAVTGPELLELHRAAHASYWRMHDERRWAQLMATVEAINETAVRVVDAALDQPVAVMLTIGRKAAAIRATASRQSWQLIPGGAR